MTDPKPRRTRAATPKPRSTGSVRRQRDYAAERERREEAARRAGWSSASQRSRYAAAQRRGEQLEPEAWRARSAALRQHGVTLAQFERMRAENLGYVRPKFENWNSKQKDKARRIGLALRINEYNVDKDLDPNDWSDDRVGYVVSFNRAIVNPRTNYDSLRNKDGSRRETAGKPRSNQRQYEYLVRYSGIMGVSEYEARYGPVNV